MTVLNASDPEQRVALVSAVAPGDAWLVACLCAAWCKTCDEYRDTFDALAALHPTWAFAWIDIEDEAELVGDHDVEDFPTLLVQHGDDVLFIGALTPQKGVAQRLLESLAEGPAAAVDSTLNLRARLL
ncbi:thioredoxin family protein [soil metagenome]